VEAELGSLEDLDLDEDPDALQEEKDEEQATRDRTMMRLMRVRSSMQESVYGGVWDASPQPVWDGLQSNQDKLDARLREQLYQETVNDFGDGGKYGHEEAEKLNNDWEYGGAGAAPGYRGYGFGGGGGGGGGTNNLVAGRGRIRFDESIHRFEESPQAGYESDLEAGVSPYDYGRAGGTGAVNYGADAGGVTLRQLQAQHDRQEKRNQAVLQAEAR
jgi:hypothetical protein